jgi:hypothetical protein
VPQFMRLLPPVLAASCPVRIEDEAGKSPILHHLIDQRNALQTKFRGCVFGPADLPTTKVDWLEIRWPAPCSHVEHLTNLPVNRYVNLVEDRESSLAQSDVRNADSMTSPYERVVAAPQGE